MKKTNPQNLYEELNRMKSLFTEERLYGNLVTEEDIDRELTREWNEVKVIIKEEYEYEHILLEQSLLSEQSFIKKIKDYVNRVPTGGKWSSLADDIKTLDNDFFGQNIHFKDLGDFKPKNADDLINWFKKSGEWMPGQTIKNSERFQMVMEKLKTVDGNPTAGAKVWQDMSPTLKDEFFTDLEYIVSYPTEFIDKSGKYMDLVQKTSPDFQALFNSTPKKFREAFRQDIIRKARIKKVEDFYKKLKYEGGFKWEQVKDYVGRFLRKVKQGPVGRAVKWIGVKAMLKGKSIWHSTVFAPRAIKNEKIVQNWIKNARKGIIDEIDDVTAKAMNSVPVNKMGLELFGNAQKIADKGGFILKLDEATGKYTKITKIEVHELTEAGEIIKKNVDLPNVTFFEEISDATKAAAKGGEEIIDDIGGAAATNTKGVAWGKFFKAISAPFRFALPTTTMVVRGIRSGGKKWNPWKPGGGSMVAGKPMDDYFYNTYRALGETPVRVASEIYIVCFVYFAAVNKTFSGKQSRETCEGLFPDDPESIKACMDGSYWEGITDSKSWSTTATGAFEVGLGAIYETLKPIVKAVIGVAKGSVEGHCLKIHGSAVKDDGNANKEYEACVTKLIDMKTSMEEYMEEIKTISDAIKKESNGTYTIMCEKFNSGAGPNVAALKSKRKKVDEFLAKHYNDPAYKVGKFLKDYVIETSISTDYKETILQNKLIEKEGFASFDDMVDATNAQYYKKVSEGGCIPDKAPVPVDPAYVDPNKNKKTDVKNKGISQIDKSITLPTFTIEAEGMKGYTLNLASNAFKMDSPTSENIG